MLAFVAVLAASILGWCIALAAWTVYKRLQDTSGQPRNPRLAARVAELEAQLTSYRAEVLDVVDRYERFAARWTKRAERDAAEWDGVEGEEPREQEELATEEGRRALRVRILGG